MQPEPPPLQVVKQNERLDTLREGEKAAAEQFHSSRPVSFPGALKTNEKLSEERAEDTDGDGSPLPEDFMEVRLIPT